jgi:tRNA threonylcarbamoyladenosine dehydratase
MAERIRAINPDCRVVCEQKFYNEQTAAELLTPKFDYVCDAIDHVGNKALLLAQCREKNLPVVSGGAAGGRRDATLVRIADLAKVSHDRLLAEVRKKLRREFGFPADGSLMNVECVFSAEAPVFAQPDGSVCGTRAETEEGTRLNCNGGFGSATFVTGTFGFALAGIIVQKVAAAN